MTTIRRTCGGCGHDFDGEPTPEGARCPRCNPAPRRATFRPFSNGTERMIWEHRNCGRCWKHTPPEKGMDFRCAIESAIVRAADLGDDVPQAILDRLEQKPGDLHLAACPEREEKRPPASTPRGPRPAPGQESLL